MADSKLTALTENTAPTTDDLLYLVDAPGGTPASRKVTLANLLNSTAITSINLFGSATTLNLGAAAVNINLTAGAMVFNESGADVDFRWEGDTEPNLLVLDAGTGFVGIGTTGPGRKLDINQTGTGAQHAFIIKNNATGGLDTALRFSTRDYGGGVITSSIDSMNAAENNVKPLYLNPSGGAIYTGSGNVGIGTTSPGAALDIYSKFKVTNDAIVTWGGSADCGTLSWDTGKTMIYGQSGKSLSLGAGGVTDRMWIDATTGNVGIGTVSPDRLLHPELANAVTNAVSYPFRMTHITSGTPANSIGVGLEFEQETSADNNEVIATIEAVVTDVTATSEDADLIFKTMAAGAAAAERWRITSAGHLLAGTDNSWDIGASGATRPRNLYIAGDATIGDQLIVSGAGPHAIGGAVDSTTQLVMTGTLAGGDRILYITTTLSPAAGSNCYGVGVLTPTIVEAASGVHALFTGLYISAPIITPGVATVTNTASLYIAGAMSATVTGANYAVWVDAGLSQFDGDVNIGGTLALGANNLTLTGTISATGARVTQSYHTNITSTNAVVVDSSLLSKVPESIFDYAGDALAIIAGMRVVGYRHYDYLDASNRVKLGVIAETVSEPLALQEIENPNGGVYPGVNLMGLTALNSRGIQQLHARISRLERALLAVGIAPEMVQ